MNIIDTLADLINIWATWSDIKEFWGIIIIALTILRVAIIIRVARNVSQRTESLGIQILCIIIATLGWPIGWLLYLVIRPEHNTVLQNTSRQYANEDNNILREIIPWEIICTHCSTHNNEKYSYCTNCGKELKMKCKECKKAINPNFEYCGYCWAPNL